MAMLKIRQGGRAAARKLRGNRGETIGETLVALLISALALVMLAGAISSTANMIRRSDQQLGSYYSGDAQLARQSGSGTMSVTLAGSGTSETRTVRYGTNAAFTNKPVVAYKAQSGT